jgi:hypothetical protein
VKSWEFPYMKRGSIDKSGVPYKLTIKKIMNGISNESSSIMVMPVGQKMDLRAITP